MRSFLRQYVKNSGFPSYVNTPLIRQMEARECGAVALGIILAYYGKSIQLAELREACKVTREGVNILSIVQAATRYDLRTRVLKRNHLQEIKLPFVIFWNFNHFIVVEAVTAQGIRVNDPAYGRSYLSNALIERYFSGIVLTFEPNESFTPTESSIICLPKDFFYPYLLIEMGRALLTVGLIDLIVHQRICPIFWLLGVLYGILHLWALNKLDYHYATPSLFNYIVKLPFTFFSRYYVDDIVARQMQLYSMGYYHAQSIQPFAYLLGVLIYSIPFVFIFPTFLFSLILAALNWSVVVYSSMRMRRAKSAHHLFQDRLTLVTLNGIRNIESIKLQGGESLYLDRLHRAQMDAYSQSLDWWQILPSLLSFLNLAVLLLLATTFVETELLSLKEAIFGFCLSVLLVQSSANAGDSFYKMKEFKHEGDKIADFYAISSTNPPMNLIVKGISLKNISFAYGDTLVVEDVNLQLHGRQHLGVVGRSGSGKSTLISLIAGLHTPQQGTAEVQQTGLALVDTHSFLLDASISENIRLLDPQITFDQIKKAAQDANLHEIIMALPQQYNQKVNNFKHPFSKGMLQCIEIARALVREPRIILFDEATSALDAITEKRVLQNIYGRNCATLLISHRLSTIRDCDEIIVMEQGKIVERGTHQSLMNTGKFYPQLIAHGDVK